MRGVRPASWPLVALRDAVLVSALSAGLGFGVNALRPDGLPFLAEKDYEILVPCPEIQGEAEGIQADDPVLSDPRTLLLDARGPAEFQAWHAAGSTSVVYDYLEPVAPEVLKRIAASGAARVVVYGDGGDPDSGEQLAKELSGKGIRNVGFVVGGAASLQRARQQGRGP